MSKYNWKEIPEDVKWLAVDPDGWLFGYSIKPVILKYAKCWGGIASIKYSRSPGQHNYQYGKYWENSLEERSKEHD